MVFVRPSTRRLMSCSWLRKRELVRRQKRVGLQKYIRSCKYFSGVKV